MIFVARNLGHGEHGSLCSWRPNFLKLSLCRHIHTQCVGFEIVEPRKGAILIVLRIEHRFYVADTYRLTDGAIDAGATQVSVLVVDAGRTSIQVIDNGKGMSETEKSVIQRL